MDIELFTDPYACMMYIVSPLAGLGGVILWRPPAYSLLGISCILSILKTIVSLYGSSSVVSDLLCGPPP